MSKDISIAAQLAEPFPIDKLSFKVQSTSGAKGMAVVYIDARDVQDRLDQVVGMSNWQTRVLVEKVENGFYKAELTLMIYDEGHQQWIQREDVGEGKAPKDAVSDALKRAAVQFGVGRFLYDCKLPWFDMNGKQFKDRNKVWDAIENVLKKNGTYIEPIDPGFKGGSASSAKAKTKADPFAQIRKLADTRSIPLTDIAEVGVGIFPIDSFKDADKDQRAQMATLIKNHPVEFIDREGQAHTPKFTMATNGQAGLIRGLATKLFADDKEARNKAMSTVAGRDIDSPSKLLNSEAMRVIDNFKDQVGEG